MMKNKIIAGVLALTLTAGMAACAAKNTAEPAPVSEEAQPSTELHVEKIPVEENTGKTVSPLPDTLTAETTDMECAASFTPADVAIAEDGSATLTFTICDYECFDAVDVSMLAPGDTLVLDGQSMVIETIEDTEYGKVINGDLENGGCCLVSQGGGIFAQQLWDDAKSYHDIATVTLPVSPDFVLEDSAAVVPNTDGAPYLLTIGDIAALQEDVYQFHPNNTRLLVENGTVTHGTRVYNP